ncbi:MAG: alpha-ketoglutarate-dependent dioxygenase AlkB [Methylococcales symbiont of Hymedesmia sp. n. MRB-2018]|nr:MAG: alpha-ketoglutarate-dependent dioxygenase AlkB [Methylococcales symbiont of Hymedesmia sp. n. MRB-2018]ORU94542.1 MAG: 2OG-Fe(II) oxygenase [Cycloclasticus sp. symbiont of Poecilosclerida sp. N]
MSLLNNLLPFNGELYLVKSFYSEEHAWQLFNVLLQNLVWQEEKIFLYGRWLKVPRLMCWYGDEDASYQYSGVNHQAMPWTEPLIAIRHNIERVHQCSFNSVMANLYRNGSDSMGCHADDEKELGINPVIASLSLGEQRLLKFRHQQRKQVIDVLLGHGDLLLMRGEIQHHWRHQIPKTKKLKSERINLTFRKIVSNTLRTQHNS